MDNFGAKIILDSISEENIRLTTMQVRLPRIILAELNKHRVFSSNARSSRAVPTEKLLNEARSDPFIPLVWGAAVKGMGGNEPLASYAILNCKTEWLRARDSAVKHCEELLANGLCKGLANRVIEPFLWTDVVITSTFWRNFFTLRRHKDAEPHMKILADNMNQAFRSSVPRLVRFDEWHRPYLSIIERNYLTVFADANMASAGRIAMVSYVPPTEANNIYTDIARGNTMRSANPPHAVPFEHIATPDRRRRKASRFFNKDWEHRSEWGNFFGWRQLRKIYCRLDTMEEFR